MIKKLNTKFLMIISIYDKKKILISYTNFLWAFEVKCLEN